MPLPKLYGYATVKSGKLEIVNRLAFDRDLKAFEGKTVEIVVGTCGKKRSNQQSRFWHGFVVSPIAYDLQNKGFEINGQIISKSDVHEMLKLKFLKRQIFNEETGEFFETVGSTTECSTIEFAELIEQVQQWAAQNLNIIISDPISTD